jgi:hypothetical protein
MSSAQTMKDEATQAVSPATVDLKVEVAISPVADVDPGRKVQKALDIAEYIDPTHNPMIPHTVVLEPGLRVYTIYKGYWFFGRPTVEELRLDLRAVLQRCRPDWQIGSAAQRTSWDKGDRTSFHPYGKAQAQTLAEHD